MDICCRVILPRKHKWYNPIDTREQEWIDVSPFGWYQWSLPTLLKNICDSNGSHPYSYSSREVQLISHHGCRRARTNWCASLWVIPVKHPLPTEEHLILKELPCRGILPGKHMWYHPTYTGQQDCIDVPNFGWFHLACLGIHTLLKNIWDLNGYTL